MKVLIIDNHDSFTYNLVQLVEQSGLCEVDIVKNNITEYDYSGFDKILFSPGPGIPSEEKGLMKSLIAKYSGTKSILGICLGHQAIAEFYGGKIVNLNQPFHGIKEKIRITESTEYLFSGLPNIINGGLYHSWSVGYENFPECLNITAISESGIIMAVSHKTSDIKGLQFHPESIMTESGKDIITNWLKN
ncbi:MAG: aminodeoxychorismate/anthranilate synthase component II [Bacteroidales bacterium]